MAAAYVCQAWTVDQQTPAGQQSSDLICSGKGCRQVATWGLLWNNPKIHAVERRKVWLSCDEHRAHLERFLNARGFLIATVPVDEVPGT